MIIILTAALILVSESIRHVDALPIATSTNPINNTLEAYSYIASYRPLVQALVSFIVTVFMLNLYIKTGIIFGIKVLIDKFWVRYRSQCSILMFTLKAAFALTVVETFFADDLSDEQWKLIDNSWVILQMWMVVFSAYFFSLAAAMLNELNETRETRPGPFGSIDNTVSNNTFGNNTLSNNNGSSSNERSPLLPSVRPTEPIKTAVVDSL